MQDDIDFGDLDVPHRLNAFKAEKSDIKRANTLDEGRRSVNITREALELGKLPIEKIAELIHARKITKDSKVSPRTREVIEVSNQIRKSFHQKQEAPRTTAQFYRAGKMLGRGAFGKVCLGMHKLSRKLVALKSINKEFMNDEKQKSKVMHEVGILLRLRH